MLRSEVHKNYDRQIIGYKKVLTRNVRLTKIYHVGLKQKRGIKIDRGASKVK